MISSIDIYTLVPLGILIIIYDELNKKDIQNGGSLLKSPNLINLKKKIELPSLNISTKLPLGILTSDFNKKINLDDKNNKKKLENILQPQLGGNIIKTILNDKILSNYLTILNIMKLTPGQLIPLGLLIYLHKTYGEINQNMNIKNKQPKEGKTSQIGGKMNMPLLNNPILETYKQNHNIKELKSSTLLPISLLMGSNTFKKYI